MFRPLPLPRTFEAALRDAGSASGAMRASALRDLVSYIEQDRRAVVGALEKALGDPSALVRSAAAVGLADVRAVESLPALLVAVEDEDGHVRQMAITAIGELGDGRARARLRRALTDARPEVRFQAMIAFSRVAPDEAPAALAQGMGDGDAAIRYIAVRCAEENGLAAGTASDAAVFRTMEGLLADADAAVRVASAIALARSKNGRALSILLEVVSGRAGSVEPEDEAAAIELLGELEVRAAVSYLERRAFGVFSLGQGAFAWQATVALARMGHARARLRIVRDLGSWSRDRRTLAVAAAGRARMVEARPLIAAMRGDAQRAEPSAVDHTLQELDCAPLGEAAP